MKNIRRLHYSFAGLGFQIKRGLVDATLDDLLAIFGGKNE
jgi:hypothetical protein